MVSTFYTWYNDLQHNTDRLSLEKVILAWTRGRPNQLATQIRSLLNTLSLPGRRATREEFRDLESELSSAMSFVRDLVHKYMERETILAGTVQEMSCILDFLQKMLKEAQDGMKELLLQPKTMKTRVAVDLRALRSQHDVVSEFLRTLKQDRRITNELKAVMSQQRAHNEKELKNWSQRLEDAQKSHQTSQREKDECIAKLREQYKQHIDLSSNKLRCLQSELDNAKKENAQLSTKNAKLKSFENLLNETKREYVYSLELNESLKIRLEAKDSDINKLKSELQALQGQNNQQGNERQRFQEKQPHNPGQQQQKESQEGEPSHNPLKLRRAERGNPLHKPNTPPTTPEKSYSTPFPSHSESPVCKRPSSRREPGLGDKLGGKGFENQKKTSPSTRRKKRSVRKVRFSENEEPLSPANGVSDTRGDGKELHTGSKRKQHVQAVSQMPNPKRQRTRRSTNAASTFGSQRQAGGECDSSSSDEWLNDHK